MDQAQDRYAILGVSPEATTNDIRAAYRTLAMRLHPDHNKNPGAELQFRDVGAAYEILGDDRKRSHYDKTQGRIAKDPYYFTTQVIASKRSLPVLGEPQVLYVLAHITANRELVSSKTERTPLNLALVLDRSSSMRGARMDRIKVAAHQIIDSLDKNDTLSVISFSDRSEILVQNTPVVDRNALKAAVNMMVASGGTEIFQGLQAGYEQIKRRSKRNLVNHIILVTDGKTYDAEDSSLKLADQVVQEGISISAMGIGDEWNDVFLDELASRTGGSSAYVNSPGAVVRFLNERVRSLGSAYAERLTATIAPDPDINLESVFKLVPSPQPMSHEAQPLQLGTLEINRAISILIQLQMPANLKEGFRSLIRLDITGDVVAYQRNGFKTISDLSTEIVRNPAIEDPPRAILDALGKLTLYRMQQKAEEALKAGNIQEATQRLENLATRLLAIGQDQLAQTAMMEARRVQATHTLSEAGRKTMKFGTRMLLLSMGDND